MIFLVSDGAKYTIERPSNFIVYSSFAALKKVQIITIIANSGRSG
jgi:hypothetical protein